MQITESNPLTYNIHASNIRRLYSNLGIHLWILLPSNNSWGKVMFSYLSVILFRERGWGVCLGVAGYTRPRHTHTMDRHHPRQTPPPPRQTPPLPRQTPPLPRQTPPLPRQTSPLPRQTSPLPRHLPLGTHPVGTLPWADTP